MAQIIKHRRGSLEALSAVTSSLQKGELVIASGSSNLTTTNGASIVFAVPENGRVQAVNRFLVGNSAPNTFAAATYNGMLDGVPYYASGSSTLYLLGEGANSIPNLVGNIQSFSSSVATSINALSASIGGGSIGNSVNLLNTFTGSQESKNSTLATYTGSVNTRLTNLESTSASVNTSVAALNTSSASQQVSIDALNTFSGSENTKASTLATYTGSVNSRLDQLSTASGSAITRLTALEVETANLETFSGSQLTKDATLATITGSLITSASNAVIANTQLNSYTSSLRTAFTASGANVTFSGDVTIPGNFTVRGTQTIVDSTTVQIGDNIIELNGSGATNAGLLVRDATSPNTVSGSLLWNSTSDFWMAGVLGSESKLLRAVGDSVVTGSSQITLQSTTGFTAFDTALATITGSLIASASAAAIANANQNTFTASANVSIAALNSYTSSNTSTTALNAFTASTDGKFATLATYTASVDSRLNQLSTDSGSQATRLTALEVETANLEGFSSSALTRLTALEVETANLETFSASANTRFTEIGVVSGSLIASASAAKTTNDSQGVSITNLNTFSASVNTSVSNINTFSSSALTRLTALEVETANLELFSGSQLTKDATLATYTGSVEGRFTSLATISGSLISSASNAASRLTTLEGTGTIQGLGTSNNVTFAKVTTTGDVIVGGDLVVQGNTVTLNTAQLVVEDKLITLASGSTSNATADGAGIEVAGTTASFKYNGTTNQFSSSVALASNITGSINLGSTAGSSKRVAFRNTNGNLDLVPTASVDGDLLQWNGTDFVMSNVIDGGSF
jgi:hypothetical protein